MTGECDAPAAQQGQNDRYDPINRGSSAHLEAQRAESLRDAHFQRIQQDSRRENFQFLHSASDARGTTRPFKEGRSKQGESRIWCGQARPTLECWEGAASGGKLGNCQVTHSSRGTGIPSVVSIISRPSLCVTRGGDTTTRFVKRTRPGC